MLIDCNAEERTEVLTTNFMILISGDMILYQVPCIARDQIILLLGGGGFIDIVDVNQR